MESPGTPVFQDWEEDETGKGDWESSEIGRNKGKVTEPERNPKSKPIHNPKPSTSPTLTRSRRLTLIVTLNLAWVLALALT